MLIFADVLVQSNQWLEASVAVPVDSPTVLSACIVDAVLIFADVHPRLKRRLYRRGPVAPPCRQCQACQCLDDTSVRRGPLPPLTLVTVLYIAKYCSQCRALEAHTECLELVVILAWNRSPYELHLRLPFPADVRCEPPAPLGYVWHGIGALRVRVGVRVRVRVRV